MQLAATVAMSSDEVGRSLCTAASPQRVPLYSNHPRNAPVLALYFDGAHRRARPRDVRASNYPPACRGDCDILPQDPYLQSVGGGRRNDSAVGSC